MHLNPITAKRLRNFRRHHRGWYSFLLLSVLFLISLVAECLCNSSPLIVRHQGKLYFPIFKFYPEDSFYHNGSNSHTDYRRLAREKNTWILWPLIPYGPQESCTPESLAPFLRYEIRMEAIPQVTTLTLDKNLNIIQAAGSDSQLRGKPLRECLQLSPQLQQALELRFKNQNAPAFSNQKQAGAYTHTLSLPPFNARKRPPKTVRLTQRCMPNSDHNHIWHLEENAVLPAQLPQAAKTLVQALLEQSQKEPELTHDGLIKLNGIEYKIAIQKECVRFPFRPVKSHPFGLDDAGRDVLARLLYATRTSLCFGLILAIASMSLGSFAGMIQGYAGGWTDLAGQRLLEIWSALPFLYIMILLGSIYGSGFWLMLFCYACFNWIGISYYMRAEMLRLKRQTFVEAAQAMGLPWWKIIFKHILPNALVPLITFFPFSLVGAIGSLAALDYLGFGLPPPTPSIGQLLQQAQAQRWAWWLILYPSLLLFFIMLLGVFIGEAIRDAFDPKK